ncbi:MAG: hypothetical protein J5774_05840 [Clostridia bacterium]|nr:hypothetical protein [Clostridia bacterium]
MGFFFYAVVVFAAFLLPFFVSADGAFSLDRKVFFVTIKLYGLKILSLKVFFDEKEGVVVSVNGKKGKPVGKERSGKKGTKRNYLPMLNALIFTKIDLTLYVGGDPQKVSLGLAAARLVAEGMIGFLPRHPDEARVEVLPCYVNDQATAKFSIRFFTSAALILYGLAHTIKGEKDAKRSDRELDG